MANEAGQMVKNMTEVGNVSAELATQIIKAIMAYVKNVKELEALMQLEQNVKDGGTMDFMLMDAKEFNTRMKPELEKRGVTFESVPTSDGRYAIFYPDNQRLIVQEAYAKISLEQGRTAEVDKETLIDNYTEDDLLVLKNVDMDVAYRMREYAKNKGLTLSIEQNDDATCNVTAPNSQADALAIAYILAVRDMHTIYAKDIKEKNDYENRINKEINLKLRNNDDFFIVDVDGYPMLRVDDEKCIYTYRDEDNNIKTEEKIRRDEEDFVHYVGEKIAEMDTYVLMSPEDKLINERTNGKLLEKMKKEFSFEMPEELKKAVENERKVKEEWKEKNVFKDNQHVDFRIRMEEILNYMENQITTAGDVKIDNIDVLLNELKTGIESLDVEVKKGKDFTSIEHIADDIGENMQQSIENEREEAKDKLDDVGSGYTERYNSNKFHENNKDKNNKTPSYNNHEER